MNNRIREFNSILLGKAVNAMNAPLNAKREYVAEIAQTGIVPWARK